MILNQGIELFMLSMEGVKSPLTIKWYLGKLKPLKEQLGAVMIEQIDLNGLRSWRAKLSKRQCKWEDHPSRPTVKGSLSMDTINAHVRAVRRLFQWFLDEGISQNNPASRLEHPPSKSRCRKGINPTDRDRMIQAASNNRDLAILMVLADTACRVGGLSDLRVDDLDLEHRRAVVREKGRGGHGKERNIYFLPETCKAIERYLAVRPDKDDDHLFLGLRRGGKNHGWHGLTEEGIYQVLRRIAKREKIKKNYNPHAFRHGSIRGLLVNGMSLAEASQIAGHSSVKVTGDIYGGFNDEELQRAHDRYSWIGSP
jgi:integrase/recombinase XerD